MTEETKTIIKEQEPSFLPKAKVGYICPRCDNGSGKNGDGIVLDKSDTTRTHWKCFKCGLYADVFDLIGLSYGLDDVKDQFEKAAEYYGINDTTYKNEQYTTNRPHHKERKEEPEQDFTDFFLQVAQQNDFSYLEERGISADTQKRFNIGYDEHWISPKAIQTTIEKGGNPDKLPRTPRCIIPTSKSSYIARDTRKDLTEEQEKFAKQKQGKTALFNISTMSKNKIIFITEGEIDAMSIEEVGGAAVGLGSAANKRLFLDYVKENYDGHVFVLFLDNDEAGEKALDEIIEGLEKMDIPYIDPYYEGKDPNEALLNDRNAFLELISSLKIEAEQMYKQSGTEYKASELLDYFRTIEQQPKGFEASTGFAELDSSLGGGLHEGLYIIGAISSLGKTTFSLQMADQIAGKGQDVIFFSLEMSKYELMSKSISRHTFIKHGYRKITTNGEERLLARDTQQIMNNRRYKYYIPTEKQAIEDAIEDYSKQAEHLYIYEGRYKGERLTVHHIRKIVNDHVKRTGNKPVIFIDYLQIIAPTDVRATDKQNTDSNVFELKEISRDFSIPVFAISSFNRENYLEPVSMTSFKESGAVEYSSDVLFGLQYAGMEYQEGDSDKKRKERIKDLMTDIQRKQKNKESIEVELKCLKNRNGYKFTIGLYMTAAFNHFEEVFGREAFRRCMNSPFDKPSRQV